MGRECEVACALLSWCVKCNIALLLAIIYVAYHEPRSPAGRRCGHFARYFLRAFLGCARFFFGVNGLGGVFSSRRSTSSSVGLGFWSVMAGESRPWLGKKQTSQRAGRSSS
jgi:hypothetical protein